MSNPYGAAHKKTDTTPPPPEPFADADLKPYHRAVLNAIAAKPKCTASEIRVWLIVHRNLRLVRGFISHALAYLERHEMARREGKKICSVTKHRAAAWVVADDNTTKEEVRDAGK